MWLSEARVDNYLLYREKYSRWVIQSEMSDDTDEALMLSSTQSMQGGWQYAGMADVWKEDDTLTITVVSEDDHADDGDDGLME